MSQAYRPFLLDILGPQFYPDRRQYPGGPPERAFDVTGWTLPYQMGVRAVPVTAPFDAELKPVDKAELPAGKVIGEGNGFILDHSVLDSFKAVNRLLAEGYRVRWATQSFSAYGKNYPVGAILVSGSGIAEKVRSLAEEFSLQIEAGSSPRDSMELKPLKLGLYQPWTADMDEGWTRWIFDTWEFPYTVIHNEDIRNGRLRKAYDVINLTNIPLRRIMEGHKEGTVPPPYAGGIGKEGLAALLEFVNDGGTLITLNASAELALTHFNVPLKNVVDDLNPIPLTISPHDHNKLYVGSQYVHQTTDGGNSWQVISPDLTTNDKSKQGFSGGLTGDNIGVEYAPVVMAIAESPKEAGLIWAGTNDGQVQITRDGGKNWTNVTKNIPNLLPWGTIEAAP